MGIKGYKDFGMNLATGKQQPYILQCPLNMLELSNSNLPFCYLVKQLGTATIVNQV